MKINELSVAEAALLLDVKWAGAELLRLTFKELLLRKVLKVSPDPKGEGETQWENATIGRGEHFSGYNPPASSAAFTEQFVADDVQVELKLYFRTVGQWYGGGRQFRDFLLRNMKQADYFSQGFFERLFGQYSLSPKGREVQHRLSALINAYDALALAQEADTTKLRDLLEQLGPLVLLAKHHDPVWLQGIFKESREPLVTGDQFVDTWFMWLAWDSIIFTDHWDGMEDGFDFGDGGACSTDSGCSGGGGCSGCGGCGGCS